MDEPQPEFCVGEITGRGDQACPGMGWAAAVVVNLDHDAVRPGPDTDRCRPVAVQHRVVDRFGRPEQQVVEDRAGDTAAADPGKRVPDRGGRTVDQLDDGCGLLERTAVDVDEQETSTNWIGAERE